MMTQKPFNQGEITYRALPLERFPLVTLPPRNPGDHNTYILPNMRSFLRGMPHLPEMVIREQWSDKEISSFTKIRGLACEYYVLELIKTRIPNYVTIPETKYYRVDDPKKQVDSPDLTILDPKARAIIAVEIKGKQFGADARAEEGTTKLINMDNSLTEATKKSEWKIADLLDPRHQEFSHYHSELAKVKPHLKLTVLIYSENLPMFQDAWREIIASVNHPLFAFKHPFVPMSLEEFEWFIEDAAKSKKSLYKTLMKFQQQFWNSAGQLRLIKYPFGNVQMNSADDFVNTFLKKFQVELNSKNAQDGFQVNETTK